MTDKPKETCPTKYNDELLYLARDYLENYADKGETIPTISGLALALNIHRDTLYDWSDQDNKKEISDILRDVMLKQEVKLVSEGLKGSYNSTITKLMLTKHGYHDKVDTDVTSKGKKISNNFIIQPVTTKTDG